MILNFRLRHMGAKTAVAAMSRAQPLYAKQAGVAGEEFKNG
jgi:hypothetical protein